MMIMATPKAKVMLTIMACSLVTSTPAFADVRTIEVQTRDLDLGRPSGQDLLQRRIDRAVRRVCTSRVQRSASEQKDFARCQAEARADAEAQAAQRVADHKTARPNLAAD
jgi:UrcA family protein